MNKQPTLSPCGMMTLAYFSDAQPEEQTDEETGAVYPAVSHGHTYFDCGCVLRSDGESTTCRMYRQAT